MLILMDLVVAIDSLLAYAEKCGSLFSPLRLRAFAPLRSSNLTQSRKERKPQNPSKSGFFKPDDT